MSSGFLDLAYLIEISIVFNLAYREVKPLFDKNKIQKTIDEITNRSEVKNTIRYCKDNPVKLAEEFVIQKYKKFINGSESLFAEMDGLYETKLINFNISVVLLILLFATAYQHLPSVPYIVNYFEEMWWILFSILVVSIVIPILFAQHSNQKIQKIYQAFEADSQEFLKTHERYLAEKAENRDWGNSLNL